MHHLEDLFAFDADGGQIVDVKKAPISLISCAATRQCARR